MLWVSLLQTDALMCKEQDAERAPCTDGAASRLAHCGDIRQHHGDIGSDE